MEQHARAAHRLFLVQRYGILSTLSSSQESYPFGSLAPYDIDDQGRIIIYVSLIAEHYRNIKQDPRASLIVTEPFVRGDPLSHARGTALLDFSEVPAHERDDVEKRYAARFPDAVQYELAHNFLYLRSPIKKVRWIGGFGQISWINEDEIARDGWDQVSYEGFGILEHMMDDHREALCDFVQWRTGARPAAAATAMASVWSEGFAIRFDSPDGRRIESFTFETPCSQPEEVRVQVIKLLRQARSESAASTK